MWRGNEALNAGVLWEMNFVSREHAGASTLKTKFKISAAPYVPGPSFEFLIIRRKLLYFDGMGVGLSNDGEWERDMILFFPIKLDKIRLSIIHTAWLLSPLCNYNFFVPDFSLKM